MKDVPSLAKVIELLQVLALLKDADLENHLTTKQVAELLAVTENHVISLIAEGALLAVDVAGKPGTTIKRAPAKFWRIPVTAYDAFIAARRSDK